MPYGAKAGQLRQFIEAGSTTRRRSSIATSSAAASASKSSASGRPRGCA